MKKFLLARLREPSTWRGLVWVLTVAGIAIQPDQGEAIVTAGMALAGLLGVFLVDPPTPELPPLELQGRAEPLPFDSPTFRVVRDNNHEVPSSGNSPTPPTNKQPTQSGWNG